MTRITTAVLALLLALPAFAQTPGAINLQGPSTLPGAPQVTPADINTAVNAALAAKCDYPGCVISLTSPGPIGSVAPNTGAFTGLTVGGASITGAPFLPLAGGTVAGPVTFGSTLAVTGAASGAGFTTLFASPPALGSVAPGSGAFTSLSASGTFSGKNISLVPGTTTFDGSGNITHAANVNTNLTGTTTGPGIQNWGYSVVVNADTLNQTAVGSIASDIGSIHNFGGVGFHGGRLGFFSVLTQVGAVTGTPGVFENIISGAQLSVTLTKSFGGSGVTPATAAGFATAINPFLSFTSGATNLGGGSGMEIDVLTGAGTSMMDVVGTLIFRYPGSTIQASRDDIGLEISATSQTASQGWHTGISFGGSGSGFPIDPAGTLINAMAGTGTLLAAKGIAWSGVTFSTSAIETPGFTVSGTGAITSPSVSNGASTLQLQTGAGALKVGSGVTIANGSVATVLGSLGPVGSHTTVQEWFQITDSAGTVRYIPGF